MSDEPNRFFNFSMDMGQLLTLGGVIVSVLGGYYTFDYRLSYIEKQLARQTDIMESSIRHDEQLKYIAEQMQEIKLQVRAFNNTNTRK